jgi:hypothetical protein
MRRFYFPLRSSVELFPDPTSVEAGTRAKEAAILYDEVFFEYGMLTASVGDSGSIQTWRPLRKLPRTNSRRLERLRNQDRTSGWMSA